MAEISPEGGFHLYPVHLHVWSVIVSRLNRQPQAIARLEAVQAGVYLNFNVDANGQRDANAMPPAPQSSRNTIAERFFRNVNTADFDRGGNVKAPTSTLTSDDLALFEDLPQVEILELGNHPAMTGEGLVQLAGFNSEKLIICTLFVAFPYPHQRRWIHGSGRYTPSRTYPLGKQTHNQSRAI